MTTAQRRKEERVRSRGIVRLLAADGRSISASIYDVSESGIAVDSEAALAPAQQVDIEGGGLSAAAVVKHCVAKTGGFRIGLSLLPTATP